MELLRRIPQLQAEEKLSGIRAIQLGSGLVKQEGMARDFKQLEMEASGNRSPVRKTREAIEMQVAAAGFAVTRVPRKKKQRGK